MIKIINGFFSILKFILLMISFMCSFYIVMAMYQKLGKSIMDSLAIFIPYFILLLLFCLNYILGQKQVTKNLFYNLTCCMVFGVFLFASYRTMFDDFMLMQKQSEYGMSFHYFSDMVAPLKSMLYLLIAGNVCLMLSKGKEKRKAPVVIPEKEVIESATE